MTPGTSISKTPSEHAKNQTSETTVIGIVHEFNNLLQTICGYTNYALMDLPAESLLRRDLEEVMIAGKRAIELTRTLDAWQRKTERTACHESHDPNMCTCG